MKKKLINKKILVYTIIGIFFGAAILNNAIGSVNINKKELLVVHENIDSNFDIWSMFHHDAQHTGYSTAIGEISSPKEIWSFSTNDLGMILW